MFFISRAAVCLCFLCFYYHADSQSPRIRPIPRDWFKLDPKEDSVAGISLQKARNLLIGRPFQKVIVAVIDNGVDINHRDLKGIIWTNKKEIPGNGIDDDGNGYIDDVHGWNFRGTGNGTIVENEQSASTQFFIAWRNVYDTVDPDSLSILQKQQWEIYQRAKQDYLDKRNSRDPMDSQFVYNIHYNADGLIANGNNKKSYGSPFIKLSVNLSHGTHVAGIIAEQPDLDSGTGGIADHVLIMPIVATTAGGDERDKDIANAIRYAVDNGASIINMSFSKLYSSGKKLVDDAVRYAEEKNVLIVHAAGNDGVNIDSVLHYHYPMPIYENGERAENFISVGWNRPLFDYRLAHPYSDYGKHNVDLFAPGSDIYATVPGGGYDFKSGSSMSAPVVSGVAALLRSYFPSLTAKEVRLILMKSSFKPGQMVNRPQSKEPVPFNSLSVTGSIVNAYNAIRLALGQWGN